MVEAGAERGLGVGGLDDRLARLVEQIGGAAQQGGADGTVGERAAGGVCRADHSIHLVGCGLHRNLFPLLPGSGVDTPDWCCCHRAFLPDDACRVFPSPAALRNAFDMLNVVPDSEQLGLYGCPNRGVKGDVSCRDRWISGQVRGADGGIARVLRGSSRYAQSGLRPGSRRLPEIQPLHAAAHPGRPGLGRDRRHGHPLRYRRPRAPGRHVLHRRRRGGGRGPADAGPALRRHHRDHPPRPPGRHQRRLPRHPSVAALSAALHPRRPHGRPRTPPRWARRCSPRTPTTRYGRCCRRPSRS